MAVDLCRYVTKKRIASMISKVMNVLKNIKHSFMDLTAFALINLSVRASKEIQPKSILIVRLDAIGDYVLFRNFMEVLKKTGPYQSYKITLLGNAVWRSLSEELDGEYVDEFIWLDRDRFVRDFSYRKGKIKEINAVGYEIVLSPVYSRGFIYSDTIVKLVHGKEKVGSAGDLSNMLKWQKRKGDSYYTRRIPAHGRIMFEFDRNKEFFENFLQVKLEIRKPAIAFRNREYPFELPRNYAILFIGASNVPRKWSISGFAKIAEHLKSAYGYEIVVCGGPRDRKEAEDFARHFDKDFLDLVGKTSLVELLGVIHGGSLMIANETSAAHLAVALGMKTVFVIYNGDYYGRFTPYPRDMAPNYHVIYHPAIERDLENYRKVSNGYGYRNDLDMKAISFEMVQDAIDKVLSE
jgi:ADP-heptose:LPS heptosyltransferase